MNKTNEALIEKVPLMEPEAEPKRVRPGWVKWAVIGTVVLAAGFAGWTLMSKRPAEEPAAGGVSAVNEKTPEPPPFGEVYHIDDLIINPSGGRRVFMVSVGLEVFDKEAIEEIKRREPLLRDNLITMFTAQPVEVLGDVRYRQAFRSRVKKIMDYQLGTDKVTRVFFDKWVFQ